MSMIYEHQLNISKALCIHCLGVSHNRKFSIVTKSAYCCFIILYKLFFAVIYKKILGLFYLKLLTVELFINKTNNLYF